MKKTYSKPEIMFEDFTLSVNIASGCDTKVEGHSSGSCGYSTGGVIVFLETVTGCLDGIALPKEMDGTHNGICYHTPTDDFANLFNS